MANKFKYYIDYINEDGTEKRVQTKYKIVALYYMLKLANKHLKELKLYYDELSRSEN